jgi:tripartite-type tricarboxylate transporter receptor subunit TctC
VIVSRLNDEIRKIVASDDVRARIIADGADPVLDMTSDQFNALLKQDVEKWRRIVKARNIQSN